jgi:magnesium chelatase family protein
VLREPLESGRVSVSRAARQAEFPAEFQLVAAMNPCPCGYLGHYSGRCRCTPDQIQRYRGRISGPLLDRIDLQIEVPAVPVDALTQAAPGENSTMVRTRVQRARSIMLERQGKPNSKLAAAEIDMYCPLDCAGARILQQAIARLGLSARAYHRVIKVARTVADLGGCLDVSAAHVAESIQYRMCATARLS